jgi:hypothetical protein
VPYTVFRAFGVDICLHIRRHQELLHVTVKTFTPWSPLLCEQQLQFVQRLSLRFQQTEPHEHCSKQRSYPIEEEHPFTAQSMLHLRVNLDGGEAEQVRTAASDATRYTAEAQREEFPQHSPGHGEKSYGACKDVEDQGYGRKPDDISDTLVQVHNESTHKHCHSHA